MTIPWRIQMPFQCFCFCLVPYNFGLSFRHLKPIGLRHMDPTHGLWMLEDPLNPLKENPEICIYLQFLGGRKVSQISLEPRMDLWLPKRLGTVHSLHKSILPPNFLLWKFCLPPFFISEKLLKCCWNSVMNICGPFTWIYWWLISFLFCFLCLPLSAHTLTHLFCTI